MRTLLSLMPFRPSTKPGRRESAAKSGRRRRSMPLVENLEGRQMMSNVPVIGDPSFEMVKLSPGSFQYDPTGSDWSFTQLKVSGGGGSGLATATSKWFGSTNSNPPAPVDGNQAAFIYQAGTITESIPNWQAGTYNLSFYAGQAGSSKLETLQVKVDGNVAATLTPATGAFGQYTLPIVATAGTHTIQFVGIGSGTKSTAAVIDSVALALQPPPPPVANSDSAQAVTNNSVQINVLANDTDPAGYALSVSSVTQGANGAVVVNSDNTLTYTPSPNYFGQDNFTYTITDGQGNNVSANVTVNVVLQNPTANPDSTETVQNVPTTINVLANDSDPSGYALSVSSVTQGAHGSVVINANKSLTYTPALNYIGSDSFTYTISDGHGNTATATDTVNVKAPAWVPDSSFETVQVGSGNKQFNPSGSPWSFNGRAGLADAHSSYFGTNYNGPAAPPDGNQAAFISGTGSISQSIDNLPAGIYTLSLLAAQGGGSSGLGETLSVNVDGALQATMHPSYGSFNAYSMPIVFGAGSHTIKVSGVGYGNYVSTGLIDLVALALHPLVPPVANADSALTSPNNSVQINVLANDTDPTGYALSVSSVTQGANGAVVINSDNTLTYTPCPNYVGNDSFTYTITDGQGNNVTADVNVNVVLRPPTANPDSAQTLQNVPVSINVLANDSDASGYAFTVSAVSQGSHGSVVINADKSLTYTPASNYIGSDSFTYTITNSNGYNASALVTVNVKAAAPVLDSSFETVQVGSGKIQVGPSGSPWSFAGIAGIADAHSSYFGSNGPAAPPDGNQVAFISGTGSFTQSIPNCPAGIYNLSFQATQGAQNGGGPGETLYVSVDGNLQATMRPSYGSFKTYNVPIVVGAGTHTISISGQPYPHYVSTALVDLVSLGSFLPATSGLNTTLAVQDSSNYGLGLTLPATSQYFPFTTANEPANIKSLGLPLRDGVTYYSLLSSTGVSVSFGNNTVSPSGTETVAIVIDPADPCVYVVASGQVSVADGISQNGLIPFVASAGNYDGPSFSGQVWGSVGGITLGDLPVTASGNITINLDPNHKGISSTLMKGVSNLFTRGGITHSIFQNIDLGLNGALSYTPDIPGISLDIPMGSASLGYTAGANANTPGTMQFAGITSDPFEGTGLKGIFDVGNLAVKATSSGLSASDYLNNLNVTLTGSGGFAVSGYNFNSSSITVTEGAGQVGFDTKGVTILGGSTELQGQLDMIHGGLMIAGTVNSPNLPISGTTTAGLYYNYNGHDNGLFLSETLSYHVDLTTSSAGQTYGFTADATITATFFVGCDGTFSSDLSVSASGTLYLGVFGSQSITVGARGHIDNHCLSLTFNDGVDGDQTINWNY